MKIIEYGDYIEAKDWYKKGLDIRIKLDEEIGTIDERTDLFRSYKNLGDACKEEGKLDEARDWNA